MDEGDLAGDRATRLDRRVAFARPAFAEQIEAAAAKVADGPTCFAHDEGACRGVPWVELPLPEPVEASAGDVAQIERGRAIAANALRAHYEVGGESQIEIEVSAPILFRESPLAG